MCKNAFFKVDLSHDKIVIGAKHQNYKCTMISLSLTTIYYLILIVNDNSSS